ncbi:hypothetical protein [Fredinandcohnia quinoae]|uniref:ABC transporter permease n=1 Tax=Fredinandcohnia quinoae TaxID=2918902 RepID=A0AAW5EAT5_9BACI|nr:hypothetical protein [Fredinandcohnia sp. SECRCQ15]MCH1626992.1 hypothetical protein [Fredinandcohnia sp. SECRCQ15]
MKDFLTLRILDRFKFIFTRFGIEYPRMRSILQVKLIMDQRRVPTIFNQQAKKKGTEHKESNGYLKSLWLYVIFGLFTIPFMLMGDNYIFQMSLVFGILMFLVMTSMISDFSSVLLDIRDRNILYPKPVNKRTISAAKMIHVSIYLWLLTISIIGIPLIVGLFINGFLFFLVSIFITVLLDLFIVVLTALLYLLILRYFDGEKLKDLINYVQIGLSIAIMIGYQLLARSFELIDLNIALQPEWWQIFIIPMWYGAIFELVMNNQFSSFYLILAICGIVIPIISFFIYLKLVPTFEKSLQKLSFHGKGKIKKHSQIRDKLLKLICYSKEERAFFTFAGLMMKNERDFKLKVYPSLGFSLVLPFILLINSYTTSSFAEVSQSKSYFSIYFSLIIIPTVIMMLKFSGKYKGAWIYRVAPLNNLAPVFSGTMKAFIVKLYLPLYLLLCVIFIVIFGVRIMPDLLIIFMNSIIYAIICFMIFKKSLPFSESFEAFQQSSGWIVFGLMLIVPVLGGIHFISTLINFGIFIYFLLLIVTLIILWKVAFRISWGKIS